MDNVEEYWDIYSLVRGREPPQTHSVYLRFPASVRIVPSIRCHCALGIPGGMSAERDASNGLQNTFRVLRNAAPSMWRATCPAGHRTGNIFRLQRCVGCLQRQTIQIAPM
jgi:hypothetical protein